MSSSSVKRTQVLLSRPRKSASAAARAAARCSNCERRSLDSIRRGGIAESRTKSCSASSAAARRLALVACHRAGRSSSDALFPQQAVEKKLAARLRLTLHHGKTGHVGKPGYGFRVVRRDDKAAAAPGPLQQRDGLEPQPPRDGLALLDEAAIVHCGGAPGGRREP